MSSNNKSTLLIILCVLTIVGSIFTICRAFLYEVVAHMDSDTNYIRGWIYAISSIGTLIGAVMMINGKMRGLYLYSCFQLIYIITVIIATFSYTDLFRSDLDMNLSYLSLSIAMFFLVPSVVFLCLYWTRSIKGQLS